MGVQRSRTGALPACKLGGQCFVNKAVALTHPRLASLFWDQGLLHSPLWRVFCFPIGKVVASKEGW